MGWILIIHLFGAPTFLLADEVVISIGKAVGTVGDTVKIPIAVRTQTRISGIAFEAEYDESGLAFLGFNEVTQPFRVFETREKGRISCVFLNPETNVALESGETTVATMSFSIRPTTALAKFDVMAIKSSVTGAEQPFQEMLADMKSGYVIATEQFMRPVYADWIAQDRLRVGVDVQNSEFLSAIQMQMTWPHAFQLQSVVVTARTSTWQVFHQSRNDGGINLLLADLNGQAPIQSGEGSVVDLEFSVADYASESGVVMIDSLLVTDQAGKIVYVAVKPGGDIEVFPPGTEDTDTLRVVVESDSMGGESGSWREDGDFYFGDEDVHQDTQSSLVSEVNRDIKIVEILADPPAGLLGDANGDGERGGRADEFVELLNTGPDVVDLSNWYLGDDDVPLSKMFQFEANFLIQPGARVVIFGGGRPASRNWTALVDDGSIGNGLSNSGDTVLLLNALGDTVDIAIFGKEGGQDQSIYLESQMHLLHKEVSGDVLFSPGTETVIDNPNENVLWNDGAESSVGNPDTLVVAPDPDDATRNIVTDEFEDSREDTTLGDSQDKVGQGGQTLHATDDLGDGDLGSGDFNGENEGDLSIVQVLESQAHQKEYSVKIVEILADPPPGTAGDANGDGVRHSHEDEFVEIQNLGTERMGLSGWRLGDDDVSFESMYVFENDVEVKPGERVVVFGGGTVPDTAGFFFVDDGTIGNGLTNGGDIVLLYNALGDTVDMVAYGAEGAKNQSIYYEGAKFQLHTEGSNGTLFSPGKATSQIAVQEDLGGDAAEPKQSPLERVDTDSAAVSDDLVEGEVANPNHISDGKQNPLDATSDLTVDSPIDSVVVVHPDSVQLYVSSDESNDLAVEETLADELERTQQSGTSGPEHVDEQWIIGDRQIQIVEILADPPPGLAGDVNGDGVRESREDEFVEILNTGDRTVDIAGWRIGDDDVPETSMFQFDAGEKIEPGERIVLFGGGKPQGIVGRVFTDDGSIGNGLTNGGDKILLLNANGDTVDVVSFAAVGGMDQSLVRDVDRLVRHGEEGGRIPFSPNFPRPIVDVRYPSAWPHLEVSANRDFGMDARVLYTDKVDQVIPRSEAQWMSSDTTIVSIMPNGKFRSKKSGDVVLWFVWKIKESLRVTIVVRPDKEDPAVTTNRSIEGILVTEIHANPAEGKAGDTNGDGIRDPYADEFIELLNNSQSDIDLSGWYLGDLTDVKHLFQFPPKTVLSPGEYATLFGGGNPRDIPGKVFVDDGRIGDGLANAGEIIRLVSAHPQHEPIQIAFPNSPKGISLVQLDAGLNHHHNVLPSRGFRSPGQKNPSLVEIRINPIGQASVGDTLKFQALGLFDDGRSKDVTSWVVWEVGLPHKVMENGEIEIKHPVDLTLKVKFKDVEAEPLSVSISTLEQDRKDDFAVGSLENSEVIEDSEKNQKNMLAFLQLAEIHPNPGMGESGDTNGDGQRDTFGDEFIEFHNLGADTLDLSGWFVGDDDVLPDDYFRFPLGSLLGPGQRFVVWGTAREQKGVFSTKSGRIGDGLSNGGDQVIVLSPDQESTVIKWNYGNSLAGISWQNLGAEEWVRHDQPPGVGQLSPMHPRKVVASLGLQIEKEVLAVGESANYLVWGVIDSSKKVDLTMYVDLYGDYDIVQVEKGKIRGIAVGEADLVPSFGDLVGEVAHIRVEEQNEEPWENWKNERTVGEHQIDSSVVASNSDREFVGGENLRPLFQSVPDSIVLAGFEFAYTPQIFDPDGDSTWVGSIASPEWIIQVENTFMGRAPHREIEARDLILFVTDGRDTTLQEARIQIATLAGVAEQLSRAHHWANTDIKLELPFGPAHEIEIDGNLEWHRGDYLLTLKGKHPGVFWLKLAISKNGETIYEDWKIEIVERPRLGVLGVVLEPQFDWNEDGIIDRFQDQVVLVENQGARDVDLSGWYIGEEGKNEIQIPEGLVLKPSQKLRLFGLNETPSRSPDLSGGSVIGDGLLAGDVLVLKTADQKATLVSDQIPIIKDVAAFRKVDGRWSPATESELIDLSMVKDQIESLPPMNPADVRQNVSFERPRILAPSPNPFNSEVRFGFFSNGGPMEVVVYSIVGQMVRRLVGRTLPAGYHSQTWDGRDAFGRRMGSGVYLLHIRSALSAYTRRVALMRQ